MLLHELLTAQREDLLRRWNEWVRAEVSAGGMSTAELIDSMPLFVDELIVALAAGEPAGGGARMAPTRTSARVHGGERLRMGFDVTAVVREYNLLGRAVFEVADAAQRTLLIEEIQVLSDLIGGAQAEAVGEYQRKRDQEQARQASQHMSFLAHEMRTPLSTTLTAFTLARNHVAAAAGKYVAVIDRSLKRLMEVLDNALVAGRVQTGISLQLEEVNVTDCIREVIAQSELSAEHRSMTLQVEVPPALWLKVDLRLLHSVLSNLIGNAIKFSQPGSIILVRALRAHSTVIIEVEDACGGLPPDKVSAIFDPHVQIGTDRSGFGLGLAIAKQAAEAHGGTLQVQNVEGHGCCFRLELPAPEI